MGKIAVLDENMVNMIAAGEVVERPASVVKELLGKQYRRGAKKIVVSVEDGGRKLISISDDGCGMDAEDLAKAFLPHATSKIKTSDDLGCISNFRISRRGAGKHRLGCSCPGGKQDGRIRWRRIAIEFDCGIQTSFGPCSGGYGTTIEVRNLFYKLPARQKFLRTANTEMSTYHGTVHPNRACSSRT